MVILPLPGPTELAGQPDLTPQLIPFMFIADLIKDSSFNPAEPSTYIAALKEMCLLQPLFNIVLTIPFGVYLSYYFGKDLKRVIIYSFLLSLFFELTQLTGLYGIYMKPYRLFDVDDLMLNTLGGALGYYISIPIKSWLPSSDKINRASWLRASNVGFTRRLCAYMIDYAIVVGITFGMTALFGKELYQVCYAAVVLVYFIAQPAVFGGKTLGKRFVRIKLEGTNSDKRFILNLAARYGSREAVFIYMQSFQTIRRIVGVKYIDIFLVIHMLIALFYLIDFILSLRREKRLWYEMISKTRNVNTLHM
jgi:glycopeptide antibiotics resistance protein